MRIRRTVAAGWLAAPLGLGLGCSHDKAHTHDGKTYGAECDPSDMHPLARYAHLDARRLTSAPLAAQAANGTALDATVYNHHFEANSEKKEEIEIDGVTSIQVKRRLTSLPTAALHPSGVNLIRRQVREACGPVLNLYVQTANDQPIDAADPAKSAAARAKLDTERANAVRAVAMSLRPDLAVEVAVIDAPEVGMSGREARAGLEGGSSLYAAPRGFLTRDQVLGVEIGQTNLFGTQAGSGGGDVGGSVTPPAAAPAGDSAPPVAPGGLGGI